MALSPPRSVRKGKIGPPVAGGQVGRLGGFFQYSNRAAPPSYVPPATPATFFGAAERPQYQAPAYPHDAQSHDFDAKSHHVPIGPYSAWEDPNLSITCHYLPVVIRRMLRTHNDEFETIAIMFEPTQLALSYRLFDQHIFTTSQTKQYILKLRATSKSHWQYHL